MLKRVAQVAVHMVVVCALTFGVLTPATAQMVADAQQASVATADAPTSPDDGSTPEAEPSPSDEPSPSAEATPSAEPTETAPSEVAPSTDPTEVEATPSTDPSASATASPSPSATSSAEAEEDSRSPRAAQYTVTFVSAGPAGSPEPSELSIWDAPGSPKSPITVDAGKSLADMGIALPPSLPLCWQNWGCWYGNGWNTKSDGTGTAFTAQTRVNGDLTVYVAQWLLTEKYTITFNPNGGKTPSRQMYNQAVGHSALKDSGLTSMPTTTRTGYTFAGWNTSPDGTGTPVTVDFVMPLSSLTVYAQWGATITYNGNGGSDAPSQTVATGQSLADAGLSLPMLWRTGGYILTGWNTKADGTGTPFTTNTTVTGHLTVYAQWYLRPGVDVTFDGNGGTKPASIALYEGQTVTVGGKTLPTSTRAGYTFVGWNTAKTGSGTVFTADTPVMASLTVYAQWKTNTKVRLTLDPRGGSVSPEYIDVQAGLSLTNAGMTLPTPNRPGYTFGGWNTKSDGTGTAFTASTVINDWLVVYAKWTANTAVTITYKGNGGSDATSQTLLSGQSVADAGLTLPMLWRTGGYIFLSWNTKADGTGTTLTASTVITSNTTVYAQWYLRPGVDVTFDGNGGTKPTTIGLYEGQSVIDGGKTLPASTRAGYAFAGWNTEKNGSGTVFTADTPVMVSITVYAQWTANTTVRVTFDAAGGSVSPASIDVQSGQSLTNASKTLPTPTRAGYTFGGWNTKADGTGTAFTASVAVTGSLTVYAQWTANSTATVTFDGNGTANPSAVTVLAGQSLTDAGKTLPAPVRAGFTLKGWNAKADGTGTAFTAATAISASLTVYAQWTVNGQVEVFFDGNGAANPSTVSVFAGQSLADAGKTLPVVTRPGYVLAGWNTAKDGKGTAFTAATTVTGALTVFAQWTPNATLTVTFNGNGGNDAGTLSVLKGQSLTDAGATLPASGKKGGFYFRGWNTKADGTGTAFTASTVVDASLTVYAQFEVRPGVDVTFDGNGGTSPASISLYEFQTVIEGGKTLPTSTRPGYVFAGWNTQKDGSGTGFTGETIVPISLTVYAQWTANATVSVTFDGNGGPGAGQVTVLAGQSLANAAQSLPAPVRPGYTFAGWNTKADGTGTAFTASVAVTGSLTVFAQWTAKSAVTVTFDGNGATSPSAVTVLSGQSLTDAGKPLPAPVRSGYTFAGWNTKANGSGTAFTAGTAVSASLTVYAQWTVNSKVSVFFDGNGVTNPAAVEVLAGQSLADAGVSLPVLTRPGYLLAGWNTAKDGKGTAFTAATPITGSLTVFAQWTANATVTVTFDSTGGNAVSPKTLLAGQSLEEAGLALPMAWKSGGWWFVSWNTKSDGTGTTLTESTAITSSLTVYAQWYLRAGVDVTFDGNGGTKPASIGLYEGQSVIEGGKTLPTSTRPGYVFAGWNTEKDGSGTAFTGDTKVNASLTVYAQWTANATVTVTFDGNGVANPAAVTVLAGQSLTNAGKTLPTLTRAGYVFGGWNTVADGSGTAFTAATAVSGSLVVYAQWTANATVTVTFDGNGATSPNAVTVLASQSLTDAGKALPTPTRSGYTFTGWNTKANGSGTLFTSTTSVATSLTVYAQWTANSKATVFFEGNGVTSPNAIDVLVGQSFADAGKTLPTLTRPGYAFAGWNTVANGSGIAFTASTVVSGSLTVFAQWTPNATATITFKGNGGNDVSDKSVLAGQSLADAKIDLPVSWRSGGYWFRGWNTAADGTGTTFEATTIVTGSLTVYAQWQKRAGVDVTFDGNGGTTPAPIGLYEQQSIIEGGKTLPTSTRPGYVFNGWNTSADGTGTVFTGDTVVNASLTVFAQWTANGQATVTVNGNGTTVPGAPITVYVGQSLTDAGKSLPTVTRPGYAFAGWNTAQDGTGTAFSNTTVVNASLTVFAQWTANSQATVTFNGNGAADAGQISVYAGQSLTDAGKTLPTVTRAGYAFTGWNTKANGTGTAFTATTAISASVTVFAQWTANSSVTLTFDGNGVTNPTAVTMLAGQSLTDAGKALPTLSRPGYEFMGWNTKTDGSGTAFTAATAVGTTLTVYAQWKANPTATVTVNGNGVTVPGAPFTVYVGQSLTDAGLALPTLSRAGYAFAGWNTAVDGTGTAFSNSTLVTGSLTVYAQWTANSSVTLTFDGNGWTSPAPITLLAGQTLPEAGKWLPSMTRPGYVFVSWNTKRDGTGATFTVSSVVSASLTVYARWQANEQVTVSFDGNGATSPSQVWMLAGQSLTDAGQSLPTLTRPGYAFSGWNSAADGSGTAFDATSVVWSSRTVFAQWKANQSATVTLNGNGVSVPGAPTTVLVGQSLTDAGASLPTLTRAGYAFAGWNTAPDGSGTAFTAATPVTGTLTVYAQWVANSQATVTFNGNGSSDAGQITVLSGQSLTDAGKALPTLSRRGYTFGGWNTAANGSGTAFTAAVAVTGSLTVYAQWVANDSVTITLDGDGIPEPITVTVLDGQSLADAGKSLPTPSRPGYEFNGWNTQPDGSGTTVTNNTPIEGPLALYPQWKANATATVTVNGNGATAPGAPITVLVGQSLTDAGKSLPTLSLPGFVFNGWNTAVDGTGTAFSNSTVVTGTLIVYAQWTANGSAMVTFDGNGATDASPVTVLEGQTLANAGKSLPTLTRAGYTFAGWNTKANGSGTAFTASTVVSTSLTVYAQWTANTGLTVTVNGNGVTVPGGPLTVLSGQSLTDAGQTLPTLTRAGYTFAGWNTAANGSGTAFTASTVVSASLTVYAQWKANQTAYVTLNGNGVSLSGAPLQVLVDQSLTDAGLSLPTPTRAGYAFAGWNTAPDGSGTVFSNSTVISGSLIVYAQWTTNGQATVSFDGNGGPAAGQTTVLAGQSLTDAGKALPTLTRPGYTFAGWNTVANGSGTTFTASTVIGTSLTVYAQWVANGSVTITLDGEGIPEPIIVTVLDGQSLADAGKSLPTPSRPGYDFNGWNTQPDGSGTVFTNTTPIDGPTALYPQWKAHQSAYITLNGNGVSLPGAPLVVLVGQSVTDAGLSLPTPARAGYAFAGWNTAHDGTGTAFTALTPVTGTLTVYAQWTANGQAGVTLDANGGAVSGTSLVVLTGQSLADAGHTLPTPTRAGYTFIGWNTAANGSGVAFTNATVIQASLTLYAQWTANPQVIVTLDGNGGTVPGSGQLPLLDGQTLAQAGKTLPTPVRPGYLFTGWNTAVDGTGNAFTTLTTVTSGLTVYAQWMANQTAAVTLNGNGASLPGAPLQVLSGQSLTDAGLSLPTPTRAGYAFAGWNTAVDGTGTAFTVTTVVTGSLTVYAQWTANAQAGVTLNPNGGSVSAAPIVVLVGQTLAGTGHTLPTPTRAGYLFTGWNTAANGSGETFTDTTMLTDSLTVYAQWIANGQASVTLNGNGVTVPGAPFAVLVGQSLADAGHTLPTLTRPGYVFDGWNTAANGTGTTFTASTIVDTSLTVYARWTPNQTATVTLHGNGASLSGAPMVVYVGQSLTDAGFTLLVPVRPGYTFNGWNTAPNGSGTEFTATTAVPGSLTVFAQWTANQTAIVTIDSNGASASGGSRTVLVGQSLADASLSLPTLTRAGYLFAGWNTAADGSGTAFTVSTVITGSLTVFAQWTARPTASVTIDGNGATAPGAPLVVRLGQSLTDASLSLPTLTRPGYVFAGWNTAANGSGTAFTASTVIEASMTVYAQWTANATVSVTFGGNGGTVSPGSVSVLLGQSLSDAKVQLPTPTRPGFTFVGWNTAVNGTGTAFTAGTVVDVPLTVYAQWTSNAAVTVVFDGNGGTVTPANATVLADQSLTDAGLSLPTPTRPGFAFAGWNTAANGSGTAFTASTAIPTGLTVYAQWTSNITVTVVFNGNGGNVTPASASVLAGQSLADAGKSLPTPTRSGYTFVAWDTAPDGSGTAFTASTVIPAGLTVYALWSSNATVSVTLDGNGGTVAGSPLVVNVGQSLTDAGKSLPTPMRPGFTFAGWNTAADGAGTGFTAGTVVDVSITVYAQWTANATVTVTIEGEGIPEPIVVTVQSGQSLADAGKSLPTLTRPGYELTGWNTQANGSGTAFTNDTPITGPVTLFPQWKAKQTVIVLLNGNGTIVAGGPYVLQLGQSLADGGHALPTPTRAGYTFDGWNTAPDGTGDVFTTATVATTSVTLYAQWTAIPPTPGGGGNGGGGGSTGGGGGGGGGGGSDGGSDGSSGGSNGAGTGDGPGAGDGSGTETGREGSTDGGTVTVKPAPDGSGDQIVTITGPKETDGIKVIVDGQVCTGLTTNPDGTLSCRLAGGAKMGGLVQIFGTDGTLLWSGSVGELSRMIDRKIDISKARIVWRQKGKSGKNWVQTVRVGKPGAYKYKVSKKAFVIPRNAVFVVVTSGDPVNAPSKNKAKAKAQVRALAERYDGYIAPAVKGKAWRGNARIIAVW